MNGFLRLKLTGTSNFIVINFRYVVYITKNTNTSVNIFVQAPKANGLLDFQVDTTEDQIAKLLRTEI